jgi:hypothetical protein
MRDKQAETLQQFLGDLFMPEKASPALIKSWRRWLNGKGNTDSLTVSIQELVRLTRDVDGHVLDVDLNLLKKLGLARNSEPARGIHEKSEWREMLDEQRKLRRSERADNAEQSR